MSVGEIFMPFLLLLLHYREGKKEKDRERERGIEHVSFCNTEVAAVLDRRHNLIRTELCAFKILDHTSRSIFSLLNI